MLIIPAIDIRNGKCVRLTQGKFDEQKVYDENPVNVALEWKNQGAKWLHVIDLDGAKLGKVKNKTLIKKIKDKTGLLVQVGGGIRSLEDAQLLVNDGIDRLIIGTIALENPSLLKQLIQKFPNQIIVSVDAENDLVKTRGWLNQTSFEVIATILDLEKQGVKTFIYTDILKDGMMQKPNYQKVKKILSKINSSLIVAGGISSIDDIQKLKKIGVEGVIIGKAIYEERINLKEALNVS